MKELAPFRTYYKTSKNEAYGSIIYANTEEEAQFLMKLRNLPNEEFVRIYVYGNLPIMPSQHIRDGHLSEASHAATYMMMIMSKCGMLHEVIKMLEDDGLFHELQHRLIGLQIRGMTDSDLAGEFEKVERRIPGFYPYKD